MTSEFQQQTLALAREQSAPHWMSDLRERGAARWREASWPTRRTEHWKYTPLAKLQKKVVSHTDFAGGEANDDQLLTTDAYKLVFINGVFNAQASSQLPAQATLFADANAAQAELIQQHLGRLAHSDQHLFAAMSEALLQQGVWLHLTAGEQLDKPLYVVNMNAGDAPALASTRLLIKLEENASAEVIEHFITDSAEQKGFVNSQTEIFLGANAQLKHYRLNLEDEGINHVGGVFAELARDALFKGFALAKGAELIRVDYGLCHCASGAHVDLQGVYLPRGKQVVDYHTNVQHCVPHCTTSEVFRGIIGDSAKAVFNGRIHIHKDAQKTLAELSNKNLLTSNRAEIDTKPELEIYADDVQCAHGATISQLNDDALYYLQTRGVSREQARVMLSFGFINELVQAVDDPAIINHLIPQLATQFGRNSDLLLLEGESE